MGKRFIECRIFYRVAVFEALVGNFPVAHSIDVECRPVAALRAHAPVQEGAQQPGPALPVKDVRAPDFDARLIVGNRAGGHDGVVTHELPVSHSGALTR